MTVPNRAVTGLVPVILPPNPIFRFYRGGAGIDRFRGLPDGTGPGAPEDWVGSTTTSLGSDTEGLAYLADGRVLRDAIAADPVGYLGPEHVARLGANPGLLVKLLDTRERLAVHFHPGREFARTHLHSRFGKTESWLILDAQPGASMHLGLRRSIDLQTLRTWVDEQNAQEMLDALNQIPVRTGDVLYVPAGTLHSIGSGITLVELQEPSDMSVVVEWKTAGVSGGEETLHLGWDTVLPAANTQQQAPYHASPAPALQDASTADRLLPAGADPFFRAERLTVDTRELTLDPQFSILIVTEGNLDISSDHGEPLHLIHGETALIPHGAGTTTCTGHGSAIRCLPPATDQLEEATL